MSSGLVAQFKKFWINFEVSLDLRQIVQFDHFSKLPSFELTVKQCELY